MRAIAPDDPESGLTHIFDLEVGDCFGDPGAAATPSLARDEEVHSVEVVPCDVTHMYELIDVVVHEAPSGADFPGSDALFEYGSGRASRTSRRSSGRRSCGPSWTSW